MARYHGRHGIAYVSSSGTTAASPAVGLSDWSLDFSTDKVDSTAMGDANKQYVQGLKDVKGQFSGTWDDTYSDTLFSAGDSADGVIMYVYPSTDAATKYFYGPAWIDPSIDGGVGKKVSIKFSVMANGNWGRH